jgi:hypothetical protein
MAADPPKGKEMDLMPALKAGAGGAAAYYALRMLMGGGQPASMLEALVCGASGPVSVPAVMMVTDMASPLAVAAAGSGLSGYFWTGTPQGAALAAISGGAGQWFLAD